MLTIRGGDYFIKVKKFSFLNSELQEYAVSLSDKEVRHVAKLAAIQVEDSEIPQLQEQLNSILTYVEKLSDLPTKGVMPTYHVHGVTNVFREDVLQKSLDIEDLKKNAPDFSEGFYRVPQIIKQEKK